MLALTAKNLLLLHITLQPQQRQRIMQVIVKIAFQGALGIGDELLPHLAEVGLVGYRRMFADVGDGEFCV